MNNILHSPKGDANLVLFPMKINPFIHFSPAFKPCCFRLDSDHKRQESIIVVKLKHVCYASNNLMASLRTVNHFYLMPFEQTIVEADGDAKMIQQFNTKSSTNKQIETRQAPSFI